MGYELALTLKQEKCAGAIAAAPLQMLALSPPPQILHGRKAAGELENLRGRQQISLDMGTSLCARKSSICLALLLGKDMIEGKRVEVCAP